MTISASGGSSLDGSTSSSETWLGGGAGASASTANTVFIGNNAGNAASNAANSVFIGVMQVFLRLILQGLCLLEIRQDRVHFSQQSQYLLVVEQVIKQRLLLVVYLLVPEQD